jgi:hypothetical protein
VLIALGQLPRIIRRSEDNDRYQAGPHVGAEGTEHFQSIDARQLEVEQNETRWRCSAPFPETAPAEQEIEGFFAIPGYFDVTGRFELLERPQGELDFQWIVLNQKDVGWCGRWVSR